MKLAIATDAAVIAHHFGSCRDWSLYTLSGDAITEEVRITTVTMHEGDLPGEFLSRGVTHVLCGGIGPGALARVESLGIVVIPGLEGPVASAVDAFCRGDLIRGAASCDCHESGETGGCACSGTGTGHRHHHGDSCGCSEGSRVP